MERRKARGRSGGYGREAPELTSLRLGAPFRIVSIQGVDVRMTERVRTDLHPDLPFLWGVDDDLLDLEGLLGCPGDSRLASDRLHQRWLVRRGPRETGKREV